MKAGAQLPENVNMADMKYTIMAVKQWPEEKQNMFMQGLKKVFEAANMQMPNLDAMK